MNAVAVTGRGWVTPLGSDIDGVWKKLLEGQSAIQDVPSSYRIRNTKAAVICSCGEGTPAERMLTNGRQAISAALQDAGVQIGKTADETVFLILGTSHGARLDEDSSEDEGPDDYVRRLAAEFGAKPVAVSTACSSGSDAILLGAELIRSGLASRCICGGVDVVTEAKRIGHTVLGTMSPNVLASFDETADGTLLGEGAAILVLEAVSDRRHYGLVRGYGTANDAAGLTAPDASGLGLKYAIGRCLSDADLALEDIQIVNAHGSGTPANDANEATVYSELFCAEPGPVLFATKGALGHSLGATGAIEAIVTLLALETGQVPPVHALRTVRKECRLSVPAGGARIVDARFGLSVTVGFGGFNTALLFQAREKEGE